MGKPFLQNLFLFVNAADEEMAVDVELPAENGSPIEFFEDGDIELSARILDSAGAVVANSTVALVEQANRGDTHARYYSGIIDVSAGGTNHAAGWYRVQIFPTTTTWTQTSPQTGDTRNRDTDNVSTLQGRIYLEAAGAVLKAQYSF